jgi:hypothetical protein
LKREYWWARLDLNQEPTDYESAALTVELRARSRADSTYHIRRGKRRHSTDPVSKKDTAFSNCQAGQVDHIPLRGHPYHFANPRAVSTARNTACALFIDS